MNSTRADSLAHFCSRLVRVAPLRTHAGSREQLSSRRWLMLRPDTSIPVAYAWAGVWGVVPCFGLNTA